MKFQLSKQEAHDEIFRHAHYYVHLANRTECEHPIGSEAIKHLRGAVNPSPDMTPQLALKSMITQMRRCTWALRVSVVHRRW
jgi:hypothetical protein